MIIEFFVLRTTAGVPASGLAVACSSERDETRAQPLLVDVELDVAASHCERLPDTVNYEMIGEAARAIAAQGHVDLVETFAERLAQACFFDHRVTRARVRVEKPLALAPHAAAAGVEITAVRS